MKELFEIEHLDSQGQGVSKLTDRITFIPKVLPGEQGNCQVYAKKSKVQFAKLVELTQKSQLRVKPDCIHYNDCPSCHYQHVEYENELKFKTDSFRHLIKKFLKIENIDIQTHSAPNRFSYRNRIQLHYNKRVKKLGQFSRAEKDIIEIPKCLIPNLEIQKSLEELYKDQHWLSLIKNGPIKGHIELYQKEDGEVHLAINQDYAHGGFTQVNEQMNLLANNLFKNQFHKDFTSNPKIIDLFGGKGNLTAQFDSPSLVVDAGDYEQSLFKKHQRYIQCNLYQKNIVKKLENILEKQNFESSELLILDPPRSGFKELSELVDKLGPSHIYYMSCQADTALRDIAKCQNYQINTVHLVDFFPATYHFESIFFLSKTSS